MASRYDRIAAAIRAEIEEGRLQPGDQLSPEGQLASDYDASLGTVRRALAELAGEGLLERLPGKGTFVRKPRVRIVRTTERYQWEKDRVRLSREERSSTGATEKDTGLQMSDLDFFAVYSEVAAPVDLAEVFKVEEGRRLLKRVYRTTRRIEGVPLSITTSYLPYDVVAQNPKLLDASNEPWPGGTQHQLSTIGIELDRIEDIVHARPPLVDEVDALGISPGVAALVMRKISYDTSDRVVEVSDIMWPGDRIELKYVTKLTRWDV